MPAWGSVKSHAWRARNSPEIRRQRREKRRLGERKMNKTTQECGLNWVEWYGGYRGGKVASVGVIAPMEL